MNDVARNTADVHDAVRDVRPVIVVSQCLGFAAVRYNGAIIDAPFVQRLAAVADVIEVCPEVGIGLGVPRPPIRMQRARDAMSLHDAITLVQPGTARDITKEMHAYAVSFLDTLDHVDGFILKARSPSCGIDGVNVYDGDDMNVVGTAAGRFADEVLRRFPDVAVQDELALREIETRARFLTQVFASARRRSGSLPTHTVPFPAELLGWPES